MHLHPYLRKQDIVNDKPLIPQWNVTIFYTTKAKLQQVFADIAILAHL